MDIFLKPWTDHIADVTGSPEYQTVTVQIVDPSVKGVYDIKTDTWSYPDGEPPVVYEDRARLIFPRWGVFSGGESQANSKTNLVARLQIPQHSVGRIRRGFVVKVLAAPRNPSLVGQQGRITSDAQGGDAATRTFECSWDSDNG